MKNKFKSQPIPSSEITPKHLYLSRRDFMRTAGIVGASALLAACAPATSEATSAGTADMVNPPSIDANTAQLIDEYGDPANSFKDITHYNNYYEFTTDKQAVANLAKDFKTNPWTVEVSGLVNNPKTLGIEDLTKAFTIEERIYRMRCVEGWSMVIPWLGFSLSQLLKEVEPTADAKFVHFETLLDPDQMPGQKRLPYPWPYEEGLRLDEAMNNLTILSTGLYGESLLPQSGAPLRLVVPWKYGFKSIKSIVKIELVASPPSTTWSTIASNEYGFFANVNPEVSHPRWSQASERRIGETGRRPTLLFNGYADDVAHLYEGMDLSEYY